MYNSSSVPFHLPQSIFMKIYCAYLVCCLLWLDYHESLALLGTSLIPSQYFLSDLLAFMFFFILTHVDIFVGIPWC